MNSQLIRQINIPEGAVEKITNASGKILWQRPHIYGVSWNGTNTPLMTRTDDSASFATPVIGTGSTKGSSPFDTLYPWSEMKVSTIDENVVVSIPKFWYKWTASGAQLKLQICDRPIDDFLVSPMHADRGDGKGERDVCYIGKYRCASSDLKSRANVAPKASITLAASRTGIANLGAGFYQQDYAAFWTIRMLFLVEWATWDGQSVMQNTTNFSSLSAIVSGGTANMAYHTGISANGYSIQYRYIEDLWENMLEWVDGIYFSGSNVYCINNPNQFATGSNGTKICTRPSSDGYIKSWTVPTVSGYEWALFPASTNSGESYVGDGYYYPGSGTTLYVGGARNAWELHGPFFIYTDFTDTQESTVISPRLMYLP